MPNCSRNRKILLCIGVVASLSALLGLTASPQQITASGSKIYGAASTTSYATLNIPQGTAPTTPADGDEWYDSTQQALSFRQSANTTVYQGGVVCVNVTPVTANAVGSTSPQALQACTIPAALMNVAGKTIRIFGTGTMSVPAAGTAGHPAVNVTYGGSSNTVCSTSPGTSNTVGSTNNTWEFICYLSTEATGSSGKFYAGGSYSFTNTATATASQTTFGMGSNSAVPSGGVDLTSLQTLQVTITFSANSSTTGDQSTMTENQLVVEVMN